MPETLEESMGMAGKLEWGDSGVLEERKEKVTKLYLPTRAAKLKQERKRKVYAGQNEAIPVQVLEGVTATVAGSTSGDLPP
eukprot:1158652-Pelagomonas_calceolata.AAC.1